MCPPGICSIATTLINLQRSRDVGLSEKAKAGWDQLHCAPHTLAEVEWKNFLALLQIKDEKKRPCSHFCSGWWEKGWRTSSEIVRHYLASDKYKVDYNRLRRVVAGDLGPQLLLSSFSLALLVISTLPMSPGEHLSFGFSARMCSFQSLWKWPPLQSSVKSWKRNDFSNRDGSLLLLL